MKSPVFTGSSTAIITPFKNGKVDFDALGNILNIQKIAGTAAITVCGTTGEAVTMAPDEQKETIKFCVENSNGMKIVAGAGTNDTKKALMLCKTAEDYGADAVLVVTPYYNKPSQSGLIEHYTYIADSVKIPLIMYNVPSRTGVTLTADTCLKLSEHENINGIKEASGNLSLATEILSNAENDLNVWSGNDELTVPMMSLGAKGVISVASNIVPSVIAKLCSFCSKGRYKEAAALQLKYQELINALFLESNPIPVKYCASLMGICNSEYRLPLLAPSEMNKKKLHDILLKYSLI